MTWIRQCTLLLSLSLSTLNQRLLSSLTIVMALACVTAVLTSMLSITAGITREYHNSADPLRAVVLPKRETYEDGGGIEPSKVGTIVDAPGIARAANGKEMADPEVLLHVPSAQGAASGGSLTIRGIGAAGLLMRPQLRLVSGRPFVPGREELIMGTDAQRGFRLKLGDGVIMRNGAWPIVGTFFAPGVLGSELIGDANTIATMARRKGFGSVQVTLQGAEKFAAFSSWLKTNPALAVSAETQEQYYSKIAAGSSRYFTEIAYLVSALMSIGALFGTVNILYGVATSRTRELATLRAIGYQELPVALSVMFEAVLLALVGAGLGDVAAWLLFNGHEVAKYEVVYQLFVSPQLLLSGAGLAAVLAILGSVLPATRAARMRVAEALRAL
ncbi:MAG: FtsX-like permease family protein [Steroidobacteraceae bacterium]